MVSFDVVSLFTNVPMDLVYDLIRKHWDIITQATPLTLEQFLAGICLCSEATIIQFQGRFYQQIFGCPMGSSLSGPLANLVMVDLETQALLKIPKNALQIYARYVDDVFALALLQQCQVLLGHLNNYHPRLRFTMEQESDHKLPFLDILVQRDGTDLHTTVYSKPTSTERYLDFTSPSPFSHKYTTAQTLLKRALTYPDSAAESLNQIRIWKNILMANNYPERLLDNIVQKTRSMEYKPTPPDTSTMTVANRDQTIYIPIPYIQGLHQRLQNLMPANVKLASRAHNQISRFFSNVKDVVPLLSMSNVIYNIPCKSNDPNGCPYVYIGMTSTSVQTRFTNHKYAISHSHLDSSLFDHISKQPKEHVIDFDHATILDRTHRKSELAIREAWRIHTGINLMNLEKDCASLPGLY